MSSAATPGLSGIILRFAGYVLAGLAFASLALAFFLAQKALLFADDVVRTTGTVVGYRESPQAGAQGVHAAHRVRVRTRRAHHRVRPAHVDDAA
jgi:hypothetical protein